MNISVRVRRSQDTGLPFIPVEMWQAIIRMFPRHQIGVPAILMMGDPPENDSN